MSSILFSFITIGLSLSGERVVMYKKVSSELLHFKNRASMRSVRARCHTTGNVLHRKLVAQVL
jgi:hypothetical protein